MLLSSASDIYSDIGLPSFTWTLKVAQVSLSTGISNLRLDGFASAKLSLVARSVALSGRQILGISSHDIPFNWVDASFAGSLSSHLLILTAIHDASKTLRQVVFSDTMAGSISSRQSRRQWRRSKILMMLAYRHP
jgi:hypothetical protein